MLAVLCLHLPLSFLADEPLLSPATDSHVLTKGVLVLPMVGFFKYSPPAPS